MSTPGAERPPVEEESSLPPFVRDELPSDEVATAETPFPVVRQPPPTPPSPPAPPVAPQPGAPLYGSQLQSEKVVVAAPMSFAGSAARIWKLVQLSPDLWGKVLLGTLATALIAAAWTVILAWYMIWGLWLVPYRLIRRGSRKRKREALQHRELIAAIQERDSQPR